MNFAAPWFYPEPPNLYCKSIYRLQATNGEYMFEYYGIYQQSKYIQV